MFAQFTRAHVLYFFCVSCFIFSMGLVVVYSFLDLHVREQDIVGDRIVVRRYSAEAYEQVALLRAIEWNRFVRTLVCHQYDEVFLSLRLWIVILICLVCLCGNRFDRCCLCLGVLVCLSMRSCLVRLPADRGLRRDNNKVGMCLASRNLTFIIFFFNLLLNILVSLLMSYLINWIICSEKKIMNLMNFCVLLIG